MKIKIIEQPFSVLMKHPDLHKETTSLYNGFNEWAQRKIEENQNAFYIYDKDEAIGFMYLKTEYPLDTTDITLSVNSNSKDKYKELHLKIGSLCTVSNKLFTRSFLVSSLLDLAFQHATTYKIPHIYCTVYPVIEDFIDIIMGDRYKFEVIGSNLRGENVYLSNNVYL